jgi:hypothetical protein
LIFGISLFLLVSSALSSVELSYLLSSISSKSYYISIASGGWFTFRIENGRGGLLPVANQFLPVLTVDIVKSENRTPLEVALVLQPYLIIRVGLMKPETEQVRSRF